MANLGTQGDELLYATYVGGSQEDLGNGIAVDRKGNVYVTGNTTSLDFPTVNAVQQEFGGDEEEGDAFVVKLNRAGSKLVYSTYLGGEAAESGSDIAIDSWGSVHVTGETRSTDFPIVNALQAIPGGGFSDSFVAKLDRAGSELVYSTYLGGSDFDVGLSIAVDRRGNAYVTGSTEGDALVAKLNGAGKALVYAFSVGGSAEDASSGIAVDRRGSVYVTGQTWSTDFPTINALQPIFGGGFSDSFVVKILDGRGLKNNTAAALFKMAEQDSKQAIDVALEAADPEVREVAVELLGDKLAEVHAMTTSLSA